MSEKSSNNNMDEILKPFLERASQAEDRLAKLESLLLKKDEVNNANEEVKLIIKDFQSKLQITQEELMAEREKSSKLEVENKKLQYRVTHLVKALKEADLNLKI